MADNSTLFVIELSGQLKLLAKELPLTVSILMECEWSGAILIRQNTKYAVGVGKNGKLSHVVNAKQLKRVTIFVRSIHLFQFIYIGA